MGCEEKLLHETAEFLNAAGIFAEIVVPQPAGLNKPYLAVWRTIPGANVFVHGMNYMVMGADVPYECPIEDRAELARIVIRIHKGECQRRSGTASG